MIVSLILVPQPQDYAYQGRVVTAISASKVPDLHPASHASIGVSCNPTNKGHLPKYVESILEDLCGSGRLDADAGVPG